MPTKSERVVRRSTVARESSVDVRSIAEFLVEHLGPQLLALTVGVDDRTVRRWAREANAAPRFESELRLRSAYQVFQMLQQVEAPSTIRAWFMGMNPQLDDRSPAEGIRDGDAKAVLAAARAFVNAG